MFKEFREFAMRGNVLDMAAGITVGAITKISEGLSSLDEAVPEREVTSLYKSFRGCRDTIAGLKAKLKQMNEYTGGCLILPERH
ncbi:MAG TPA: MscL family protein [Syntrophorhabdales bacterium]|nr:MscL family protein [Syntrophorhabdales bacterium]